MKLKKIIASFLCTNLIMINCLALPSFAISKKNVIKAQVNEYKYDYVNMPWWENFDDDFLNEYIKKAIENNHDLKNATLRVEQYHQLKNIQLADELPSLAAGFAPNYAKLPNTTTGTGLYSVPLVVNYELDIFLKNRDKTRSAKKLWEASKIDEQAAYISIASAVGTTYFNLIKLDRLIEIQNEIVASRTKIYELMKSRNEIGITSTADLMRADKSLILAKTDLIELKKAQSALLNAFAVLIGESPENVSEFERAKYNDTYFVSIPNEIASEIVINRPDYKKAEIMVQKSGIDVRIAKKEFLPSLNILGAMLFNSTTFSKTLNWSSMLGMIGGAALLPIFTGGKRIANLKLKKNVYEQVLNNYQKTNLTAIQEVNDALSKLKHDDEKYKQNLQILKLEEKDLKYNQNRYDEGIISQLNLIQRKENLLVIEKMVVANKIESEVNMIGLYKACATKI